MMPATDASLLPDDILEIIFSHLGPEDLYEAEAVCQRWSYVVVWHFWRLHLLRLYRDDPRLERHVREDGKLGGATSSDTDADYYAWRRTYLRVERGHELVWTGGRPREKHILLKSVPGRQFLRYQVAKCVTYDLKVFISYNCQLVEAWDRDFANGGDESDAKPRVLAPQQRTIALADCLALHSKWLLGVCDERQTLVIWDAETEERSDSLPVEPLNPCLPQTTSDPSRGPGVYSLKINSNCVACLIRRQLLLFQFDHNAGAFAGDRAPWRVLRDFDLQHLSRFHNIVMNETFLVSYFALHQVGDDGAPDVMLVRKLSEIKKASNMVKFADDDKDEGANPFAMQPTSDQRTSIEEIAQVQLSATQASLLAVLYMESVPHSSDIFQRQPKSAYYVVRVFSLHTRRIVHSFAPSTSLFSPMQMPAQWVGERLHMKLVPKDGVTDGSISLAVWDSATGRYFPVKGLRMDVPKDQLWAENYNLTRAYTGMPTAEDFLEVDDDERCCHCSAPDNEWLAGKRQLRFLGGSKMMTRGEAVCPKGHALFRTMLGLYDFWNAD